MHLILVLGLLLPVSLLAQTGSDSSSRQTDLLGKRTLTVSLNGAGGYGGYIGPVFRLTPRVSYFLADGWSVSLEGRHENFANSYRYAGLGMSSRYYFVRDRRLALFLQAGVTAGQTRSMTPARDLFGKAPIISHRTVPTIQTNVGLGIHYRLSSRWAVEGSAESTLANQPSTGISQYRTQANLGVSFKIK